MDLDKKMKVDPVKILIKWILNVLFDIGSDFTELKGDFWALAEVYSQPSQSKMITICWLQ